MKKMNNKGFSLVELIVVVLIMAIIAVALAPQVMKWVENSRKSTDCNNYDSIVSAVNVAIADEKVMKSLGFMNGTTENAFYITWYDASNKCRTGATWTYTEADAAADLSGTTTSFSASVNPATIDIATITDTSYLDDFMNFKMGEILGTDWFNDAKLKRTADYPGDTLNNCYYIKVNYKGVVERVNEPGQPDSSTAYKDNKDAA